MKNKIKKITSPIDGMIVDLIMEHYNVQSFKGRIENLSGWINEVILDYPPIKLS